MQSFLGDDGLSAPDLTTNSDHNGMPSEAIRADMLICRCPGQRQHPTRGSYFASRGSRLGVAGFWPDKSVQQCRMVRIDEKRSGTSRAQWLVGGARADLYGSEG